MSFKSYVAPLVTTSKPLTAIDVASAVTAVAGVPMVVQLLLTPEVPEPAPAFTVTSSAPAVVVADVGHNNSLNILGLSVGSADITVTAGGVSKVVSVTVEKYPDLVKLVYPPVPVIPATAIALTASSKTITTLQQFDLSALVTPYNFNVGTVLWSSSDADIADVADISYIEHRTGIYRTGHTATIRGMKAGTATITATIGAVSASCTVTVA